MIYTVEINGKVYTVLSPYQRKKRFPDDAKTAKDIREITLFFCSQYFEALSDLDGPMLLKKIIEKEGGDAE